MDALHSQRLLGDGHMGLTYQHAATLSINQGLHLLPIQGDRDHEPFWARVQATFPYLDAA